MFAFLILVQLLTITVRFVDIGAIVDNHCLLCVLLVLFRTLTCKLIYIYRTVIYWTQDHLVHCMFGLSYLRSVRLYLQLFLGGPMSYLRSVRLYLS
jgi:hypothetical protein